MVTLSPSTAIELVRKNLDELDPNGSVMYEDENGSADEYGDNASLDDIIRRNLPEAINAVHLTAPVAMLEGKEHDFTGQDTVMLPARFTSLMSLFFIMDSGTHWTGIA